METVNNEWVKEVVRKIRKLAPSIFRDWSDEKLEMFLITMDDPAVRDLPKEERKRLARLLAREEKGLVN